VLILDDGYQHRRLARDLDILLLDARDPFGSGRLLPAGILREPLAGMGRASLVLLTRSRPGESFPSIEATLRRFNRSAPLLLAGHRRVGFVDRIGEPAPRPQRAVAFCGIGNPSPFRSDLREEGLELVDFRVHPDHHTYSEKELCELTELATSHRATLVTTEKDLARLPPEREWRGGPDLLALRIEAEIHQTEPLIDSIRAVTGPIKEMRS
jgi:tetraacyldisaccharide 4'-kinase